MTTRVRPSPTPLALLVALLVTGCGAGSAEDPAPTPARGDDTPSAVPAPSPEHDHDDEPDRELEPVPDGASRRSEPSQVLRSDLGRLVADSDFFEGTNGLRLVAPDGTVEQLDSIRGCVSGAGAVSPDGARIAWVSFSCPESGVGAETVLHVRSAAGTRRVVLPTLPDQPARTTADAFRGCDVVVRRASGERLLVDPDGARPPRPAEPPRT